MKNRWISVKRLRMHEVHTTIRLLQKEPINWPQRSEIYSKIQAQAIATLMKLVGPALLGYLTATSLRNGNKIAVKISNFEAALPASFFLLSLSLLFLFLLVALNNLSVALSLKSSIAGKIRLPGFSILAYEAITGKDEMGLGLPIISFGFWKDVLKVTSVINILLTIAIISLVIPFLAFGFFLFQEQVSLIHDPHTTILEILTSCFGLLFVCTGILSLIFFHLPLPFSKNKLHVRWGFLWMLPIQPSDGERTERWSKDN